MTTDNALAPPTTTPPFDEARDFGGHRDLLSIYQRDVARHRLLTDAEVASRAGDRGRCAGAGAARPGSG